MDCQESRMGFTVEAETDTGGRDRLVRLPAQLKNPLDPKVGQFWKSVAYHSWTRERGRVRGPWADTRRTHDFAVQ